MPKSRVKASALTGLSCTSSPMKALLVVEDVHWAGEATWSSAVPQLRSAATGGLGGQQQAGGGASGTAAAALSAVMTAGATRAGPPAGCRLQARGVFLLQARIGQGEQASSCWHDCGQAAGRTLQPW